MQLTNNKMPFLKTHKADECTQKDIKLIKDTVHPTKEHQTFHILLKFVLFHHIIPPKFYLLLYALQLDMH